MNFGLAFAPLVSVQILWAASAVACILALLLFVSRSRGAAIRAAGAGAHRTRARQPLADPRGSRPAQFGRRGRGRQKSEPEFRRPRAANRRSARRHRRAAEPHSRARRAGGRGRPIGWRNRRHAIIYRARIDARGRSRRPHRRRDHDHRRARPRRAGGRRRARLCRAGSCADHRQTRTSETAALP